MIGALMLAAPMLTSGPSAVASTVQPAVVRGNYTMYVNWNGSPGWMPFPMTLNRNHTGIDGFGDVITWSLSGKSLQMTFNGGGSSTQYFGTKTRTGFNRLASPGTMLSGGSVGVWYAVKTP